MEESLPSDHEQSDVPPLELGAVSKETHGCNVPLIVEGGTVAPFIYMYPYP